MSDFTISSPRSTVIGNLIAGGPGSGRRPEGVDKRAAIEAYLQKNGFRMQDPKFSPGSDMHFWSKQATANYNDEKEASKLSGFNRGHINHTVAVHSDGSFEHTEEGVHNGKDLGDLTKIHLEAAAQKLGVKYTFKAGGPGSGRKICSVCKGTGYKSTDLGRHLCQTCKGSGYIGDPNVLKSSGARPTTDVKLPSMKAPKVVGPKKPVIVAKKIKLKKVKSRRSRKWTSLRDIR